MGTYNTNNIWLVAALLTYGLRYDRIDSTNPRQKEFVYIETPDFQFVVAEYFSGRLNIPALQFKANYETILKLVKNEHTS